jgi:hypothetical protein
MTAPALFIITISHNEILECDTAPFIEKMRVFTENPKPELARNFCFSVDGYNDIPDEVFTIQEVRQYYKKLDNEWPYSMFFSSVILENLANIAFSVIDGISVITKAGELESCIHFDKKKLADWIVSRLRTTATLYQAAYQGRHEEGEKAFTAHAEEILSYFINPHKHF